MIPWPNHAERPFRLMENFLSGKSLLETGSIDTKNDSSSFLAKSTRKEQLSFNVFTAAYCPLNQFDDREFSADPLMVVTQHLAFIRYLE
jgi:hypothetical protein